MSVIDFDSLLKDISPDEPSGVNLEYDLKFREVESQINGKVEKKFIGGKQVEEHVPPNWRQMRETAVEVLERTHDLRMAIYLVRSLVHTSGVKGLRDGFSLILGMVDEFWDTLHPELDSEDADSPIRRINALSELSDYSSFVRPLRSLKLCKSSKMGHYGLLDMDIANGKVAITEEEKENAPTISVIDAAFQDTDVSVLSENRDAVHSTIALLGKLEISLKSKIGEGESVDLKSIQNVLEEMSNVFDRWLPTGLSDENDDDENDDDENDDDENDDDENDGSGESGKPRINVYIKNRQDVLGMLDRICEYYRKNEPGSPVPLFLMRARSLVNKSFIEIINDMVPDSVDQIQSIVGCAQEDDSVGGTQADDS